ncbi:MAG TPA: YbhB/YbcL family Raf kinase inhibitor-like protein [Polyangiaceae bacterium]|jgi:hypothetical protein
MGVAHDLMNKFGHALGGVRAGVPKLASRRLGGERTIVLSSPAFVDGESLPPSATKDGGGIPPELRWESVPAATQSLVLICEDPDAPLPEPFVHWLVYDIAPAEASIGPSNVSTAREGKNSNLKRGFTPAAPPAGHGVHHYHFQIFALDVTLGFAHGVGRRELVEAMSGHVLAWGELCGSYERK